jgi:hypothetical protein
LHDEDQDTQAERCDDGELGANGQLLGPRRP